MNGEIQMITKLITKTANGATDAFIKDKVNPNDYIIKKLASLKRDIPEEVVKRIVQKTNVNITKKYAMNNIARRQLWL